MLVDSHCHLDRIDLAGFDNRMDKLIAAAQENDVGQILCVGIDIEAFPDVLQLAERYPSVYCSVGVHPTHDEGEEPSVGRLVQFAQSDRVIAIGETGLDYYRNDPNEDLEWQRDRFRVHIAAAKQTGKPLIIHTRSANADTVRILREEDASEVGGVMHCFAEDWAMAEQCLELGFHISFSGIVTFNNAHTLREVARRVPAGRLLVETDSPWLAPVPKRGKLNHPAYVRYVAEKVAEVRGQSYAEIADITTRNFHTLFKLADA